MATDTFSSCIATSNETHVDYRFSLFLTVCKLIFMVLKCIESVSSISLQASGECFDCLCLVSYLLVDKVRTFVYDLDIANT